MASKNDKYSMFRNFMINELEITKEDIRQWIKDSIEEEAKKIVENSFGKCNPEEIIKKCIFESDWYLGHTQKDFNNKIISKTAEILAKNINLSINKDEIC